MTGSDRFLRMWTQFHAGPSRWPLFLIATVVVMLVAALAAVGVG